MARNARTPLSPRMAEEKAQEELRRIGCRLGPMTDFKPGKRCSVRGKNRNGQHRGHRCSRTGASGKKAAK